MRSVFSDLTPHPRTAAVIPAAGSSTRMGGVNKLLLEIDGVPVLARTLLAFEDCPQIDEIIVVCREQDIMDYGRLAQAYDCTKVTQIIRGGATRTESVLAGVRACGPDVELVAIHDGARPLVSEAVIRETLEAAAQTGAAAPVVPMKDSVKRVENGRIIADVPRDSIAAVQTPQTFRRELILDALARALADGAALTDDCAAAERVGAVVTATRGSYRNIKVTTPEDITAAEALLEQEE